MISGVPVPTELFLDFDPVLPWWPVVEGPQCLTLGGASSSPSRPDAAHSPLEQGQLDPCAMPQKGVQRNEIPRYHSR